ncbi:MAG: hypothetical protein ACYTGI_16720 [Planctomycetota bacterium]
MTPRRGALAARPPAGSSRARSPSGARAWRARVNLDRGDLRCVDEMAHAGVDVEALYRRLAAADSATTAPARALAALAR